MMLVSQLYPAAVDTEEELLTGNQQKELVIKSLLVTSRTDSGVRFTLRLRKGGVVADDKQYLFFREQVPAGKTWTLPVAIVVHPGDKLLFQATDVLCTVTIFAE